MGLVMEKSIIRQINDQAELEKLYLELVDRFEKHRIEIVNGRIVVREVATIAHADVVYQLMSQLIPSQWRRDGAFTRRPGSSCRRRRIGMSRISSSFLRIAVSGTPVTCTRTPRLLVAEVVSPSSVHDDHVVKPRSCALAGVPLYLVVDTFASRFRLLSRPGPEGYADEVTESLGKPLELPAPWNLTIDTAKLIEG